MQTTNKKGNAARPRGRAALDPRVLPAFDAKAASLGPARPKPSIPEPPRLPAPVEEAIRAMSEGLTAPEAALLKALAQACALRPHPTGRCEYRPEELSAWSRLAPKEVSSVFPGLCALGLCELSAIGSRDPKPCVRLPWMPSDGADDKKE